LGKEYKRKRLPGNGHLKKKKRRKKGVAGFRGKSRSQKAQMGKGGPGKGKRGSKGKKKKEALWKKNRRNGKSRSPQGLIYGVSEGEKTKEFCLFEGGGVKNNGVKGKVFF